MNYLLLVVLSTVIIQYGYVSTINCLKYYLINSYYSNNYGIVIFVMCLVKK
jgi:hypothetical protein